jgi:hypothetical protein
MRIITKLLVPNNTRLIEHHKSVREKRTLLLPGEFKKKVLVFMEITKNGKPIDTAKRIYTPLLISNRTGRA